MQTQLTLTIRDIYGGDGFVRYIDVKKDKLVRTKKNSRTRDDIGVTIDVSEDELITEVKKETVNTFRYENGAPVLRMGGAHGKLWGTLRAIAATMYTLGHKEFSKRIVDMIDVTPIWVPLEPLAEAQLQILPQILNGAKHSMVETYFDVIPLAKCNVSLVYPEAIDKHVKTLVEQLRFTSFLNKRRASVVELQYDHATPPTAS